MVPGNSIVASRKVTPEAVRLPLCQQICMSPPDQHKESQGAQIDMQEDVLDHTPNLRRRLVPQKYHCSEIGCLVNEVNYWPLGDEHNINLYDIFKAKLLAANSQPKTPRRCIVRRADVTAVLDV